jgi:hypothetical protein
VRYYENLILNRDNELKQLIESPNGYSKKHFSLLWIILHYWSRPVLWRTLWRSQKTILLKTLK